MLPDKHLDIRCYRHSFLGEELGCRLVAAVVDTGAAVHIVDRHKLAEEDMVVVDSLGCILEEDLDCSILGLPF